MHHCVIRCKIYLLSSIRMSRKLHNLTIVDVEKIYIGKRLLKANESGNSKKQLET